MTSIYYLQFTVYYALAVKGLPWKTENGKHIENGEPIMEKGWLYV